MFNQEIRKNYDASIGGSALKGASAGAALGSIIPGVGTVIGGVAGGLIGAASGFFQKKKANKILSQNPYPIQTIPVEELANQQEAERMANEGLPSAQYQQAQKNIQRQQAAAIASAQDRRMGGALVPAIQEQSDVAQGNLDAQSAEARRQNQLNLQTVNSQVANARQQAFDWNYKQKYLRTYQYANSLLGAGNANMFSGADKVLGSLTQGYASGLFSGKGKTTSTANTPSLDDLNGTGLQSTGATGYQAGNNTDILINPNSYSNSAIIR